MTGSEELRDRRIRVGVNAVFLEPGRVSGTATYTWSLLDELARDPRLELVLFAQSGWLPERLRDSDIEVVACPSGFRSVVTRVAWEQLALPGRARRAGIDVLLSTGYVSPLLGRFARVVVVHDLYYHRVPEAIPGVRRWYYRTFIPASIRRCERVVVLAGTTADDVAEVAPRAMGRVRVVHSAARTDLAGLSPNPPDIDEPYFLVVASVTANKNVDAVVRAAVELRRRDHAALLCVVGEDPYGLLADAIARHRASDAVVVATEGVDDAALAGFYRGAVAVVHPSRYEGFGLPALEAQALGVPLISSRGGALLEVAGDGALFFDHDRPDELVDAMERLLADEGLRADLVERGLRNVERFSWRASAQGTAAALLEAYEVRAARHPRAGRPRGGGQPS